MSDLLDAAHVQAGTLRLTRSPLDLVALVQRVVETAQVLTNGQTIHLAVGAAPLWVNGDAGRLEQVVLHLLTNAIRYAPGTERIDVRLQRANTADGPCAELQVQDCGPGIAADRLPRLFARPAEAAPDQAASGGLGLGLFLCKELLTAQDGAIDVRSSVGKGTSFRVRLPLLREATETHDTTKSQAADIAQ